MTSAPGMMVSTPAAASTPQSSPEADTVRVMMAEIGLDRAEHMNRFERTALFAAGADTVEIYRKKSS